MKILSYIGIAVIICLVITICLTSIFQDSFDDANDTRHHVVITDSSKLTIHTNMPIDSVELLLGMPEQHRTYSIAGSEYQTYQYRINNKGNYYNLVLEFKDNILFDIQQNNERNMVDE